MEYQIEGRNTVEQAIKAGRDIDKIFVMKNGDGRLKQIVRLAKQQKLVTVEVERSKLDEMSKTNAHQGIIAQCAMTQYVSVEEILEFARTRGENPLIAIADGITDPHNMGAIIRTCAASGVHGLIIPKRRSVGINETVEKASAGTVSALKIAKSVNLTQTIDFLKQNGVWVTGTDLETDKFFYDVDYTGATAVIIGSEGKGMSRLVKENCDFLVKIPISPDVQSLNASVAAGVMLYEVVRQRKSFI